MQKLLSNRFLRSMKKRQLMVVAILVVASLGGVATVLAYQCSRGACLGMTPFPSESLSLQNFNIGYASGQTSPSVLTLLIMNSGTGTAVVSVLSVRDATTNGGFSSFPVSASIASQDTGSITVDTSSAGLFFVHGHSYGITTTTAHNQFSFSITYA